MLAVTHIWPCRRVSVVVFVISYFIFLFGLTLLFRYLYTDNTLDVINAHILQREYKNNNTFVYKSKSNKK